MDWAIVELMGHRKRAGRVAEVRKFGIDLLQIETPQADGSFVVELYGGAAIFGMRPCTEEQARAIAAQAWCSPPMLGSGAPVPSSENDEEPSVGDMVDDDPVYGGPIDRENDPTYGPSRDGDGA